MPPALRSSSSVQNNLSATFTVTAPAGIQDGDLLLFVQLAELGVGSNPASQTGFTQLAANTFNGGADGLSLWRKTAASESGNYTWNNGTSGVGSSSVWALAISGVDPTTLNVTAGATGTGTANATQSTPTGGNFLVACYAIGSGGPETITPNDGYTALGLLTNISSKLQVAWNINGANGTSATNSGSVPWDNFLAGVGAGTAPPPSGGAGSLLPSGEADLTPRRFSVRVPTRRTGRRVR